MKKTFLILISIILAIFIYTTNIYAGNNFLDNMQTRVNNSEQTTLRLSDDIGKMADRIGVMADRIGVMADRILETQKIQSKNLEILNKNLEKNNELLQKLIEINSQCK